MARAYCRFAAMKTATRAPDRRAFLTAALAAAAAAPLAAQASRRRRRRARRPPRLPGPPPVSPVADAARLDQPSRGCTRTRISWRSIRRSGATSCSTTLIKRLHIGTGWAEGPAWNGVGRYLVWSDIPANAQMRWIEDDSRVTTFRNPSGNSNGNTFDFEGRQISCEHGSRRVARYEPNGTVTVIADKFEGKRLNSPNDVVVHPDGGIWFTDPSWGIRGNYEGNKAASETKEAVYRVDPEDGGDGAGGDRRPNMPNGLCFSPDYKKLYVADGANLGLRRGRRDAAQRQAVRPADDAGHAARSGADGMRCDADGNIWAGARPGVLVFSPAGQAIGMIRLPEVCANVCFGGAKRNRLFMTASQSLYAVYVGAVGAHIA